MRYFADRMIFETPLGETIYVREVQDAIYALFPRVCDQLGMTKDGREPIYQNRVRQSFRQAAWMHLIRRGPRRGVWIRN